MKKLFLPLAIIFMLVLSACGGDTETLVEDAMDAAEGVAAEVAAEAEEIVADAIDQEEGEEPAAEEEAMDEEMSMAITESDVIGSYTFDVPDNDWHYVEITSVEDGVLLWTNRAGIEWFLYPDFENGLLLTDDSFPYQAEFQNFEIIVEGDEYMGLVSNGDFWKFEGTTSATEPSGPMAFWSGVVWSDGVGVVGASVSVNGVTTVSEDNGFFQVSAPEATDGRNVINADLDGFVSASEIVALPSERLVIDMQQAEQFAIDPNAGVNQVDSSGTQVVIEAGQLVDENGNPPEGEITMEMYTYDLDNEDMVGDMSGVNDEGEDVSMVSAGAFSTEFTDEAGNEYNLADGATAEISIPADVAPPVEDQPLTVWSYNEETGLWEEEAIATLEDGRYVAEVSHFSKWNFDWEMRQPACIKLSVDSAYLQQNPSLQVKAVNVANGQVRTGAVSDVDNVLYNLPANADMQLFIPHDAAAPFATVNTGAPWGGTGSPAAPYDVCQGQTTFVPGPTTGSLTGKVVNASNANPIDGAEVCIVNTTTCAISNANGDVAFSELPVGSHSLKVSKDGFVTEEGFGFTIEAGQITNETIALSPNLADDKNWRIVLTWDEQIEDLDAYFWTPSGTQLSHSTLGQLGSAPFAELEIDNINATNKTRIETINLERQDGTYNYSVYNYSNEVGYDLSQARVQIIGTTGVIQEFTPPAGQTGRWWNVFNIDGATGNITVGTGISDTEPTQP